MLHRAFSEWHYGQDIEVMFYILSAGMKQRMRARALLDLGLFITKQR